MATYISIPVPDPEICKGNNYTSNYSEDKVFTVEYTRDNSPLRVVKKITEETAHLIAIARQAGREEMQREIRKALGM